MSSEKKLPNGIKLVFAPGCFDGFEGTQEELDALINEIERGFADGTFLEKSVPIEDLEDVADDLNVSLKHNSGNRNLH